MKFIHAILVALLLSFSILILAKEPPEVSLRDKIGQMLLIGFDGKQVNSESPIVKLIEQDNLGGVILFDYNIRTKTYDKNIESPEQVKKLNNDLQSFTKQGNLKHHRPLLPLLISTDYEGGKINRLGERYGFPATMSAADAGKQDLTEAEVLAETMAQTLKEAGFNLNFAPVLDMDINPENPVIGKKDRSFSSDAYTVTQFGEIFTRHFLKQNIQCAYKHFPGHGSSTQDSHLGFVDVTNTWKVNELIPYQQLLPAYDYSCGIVMTAHIVNRNLDSSGLPATLSHKMLTGLLRQQLHFNGVISTDDMQMQAISNNYSLEQALVLAINAGADMLVFGNNLTVKAQDPEQVINIIESKVLAGEINESRIDEAYQHIITLKNSLH